MKKAARKRAESIGVDERLRRVRELAESAPATLATDLAPFVRDRLGIVVAAAAEVAAEHELSTLARDLEDAYARLCMDAVAVDAGCRGKIATVEALRRLAVDARDLFRRGIVYVQREPAYGGPIDTAGPLRVACAYALLESRDSRALVDVAPLLADKEDNTRVGAAMALGDAASEGADALLVLKVATGDRDPEVLGACLRALLTSSFERNLPFVRARLKDAHETAIQMALVAMGETRKDAALAPLRELSADLRPDVAAAAMLGLSLLRSDAANAFLLDILAHGPTSRAKAAARALALQRFDENLMNRARPVAVGRGEDFRRALEEGERSRE